MIKIDNLKKSYDKTVIYDGFNLSIPSKGTNVFLGESGCGKTTLLNIIAGLDKDYLGNIKTNFQKPAYVFQEDRILPWMTVLENIKFVNENVNKQLLNHILKILHLDDKKHTLVKNLSGGQKQRVSIARAFSYEPDFILLDEPFKSLDMFLRLQIIKEINFLIKEFEIPMILVTHDIREAILLADRIYLFSKSPVIIIKSFTVNEPQENRNYSSDYFLQLESEILKLSDHQNQL